MKRLFVATQNSLTREWVPVAELQEVEAGYELRYTKGATRVPGFSGLGRMQELDKIYASRTLFPFFSNRLISKSRPEYRDYLRWLDLESGPTSPMQVLAITGGSRATDNYEIVAPPKAENGLLRLEFFTRGLRYLPKTTVDQIMSLANGERAFLMRDVQNERDAGALAIRTADPNVMMAGYVPKYYCAGISRLLEQSPESVRAKIKRVNPDAPLDMKLLLSLEANVPDGFDVFDSVDDFLPLTTANAERMSIELLSKTELNLT